ncbi:MAG TPA: hypothetical protein VIJ20_00845 [Solirubrobacteraceae bacterium]
MAVTAAAAAAVACGALAAPGADAWTRPATVSAPAATSIVAPQAASSETGAAAVAYNEVDLDAQATASAFVSLASRHGAFRPAQVVPHVQEVLAVAFSGSTLELLTATAPPGQPCCSTVQVIRRGARSGFGRPQTIVAGVGGGATGNLVPLGNGRMLAVVGAPQGLWATEAQGAGRFGRVRDLTHRGSSPAALAVTATPDGASAVVWTQGAGQNIFGAAAAPGATPSRRHTLLTVAPGHAVDGLEVAAQAEGLTVVWSESWNDAAGTFHSQVMASDEAAITRPLKPRALSAPTDVATTPALAGDADGDEVAAWDVCTPTTQACVLKSTARRGTGPPAKPRKGKGKGKGKAKAKAASAKKHSPPWFVAVSGDGPIDPGESPQLAIAPNRHALMGWITTGHVVIAQLGSGASSFGASRPLSGGLADDLVLDIGAGGEAVAGWVQGTAAAQVFASRAG